MNKDLQHIKNLQKGNRESFKYLYITWSGKLYNFVLRISQGDTYVAEDIVQAVFIKVWENCQSLDTKQSFGAYICTMAKNQLLDIYQRKMLQYKYQEKFKASIVTQNITEDDVNYRLLEEYIDLLIERLPAARKNIFILSRQHLLTNKEIAEQLGLSENTVASQLTKAIAFLKKEISLHYNSSISLFLCLLIAGLN